MGDIAKICLSDPTTDEQAAAIAKSNKRCNSKSWMKQSPKLKIKQIDMDMETIRYAKGLFYHHSMTSYTMPK